MFKKRKTYWEKKGGRRIRGRGEVRLKGESMNPVEVVKEEHITSA